MADLSQVGMFRTTDHKYWWNGDGPLPSVTTILKIYDKSDALVGWAKRETAQFAVAKRALVDEHIAGHVKPGIECPICQKAGRVIAIPEEGRVAEATRWVATLPDYQRDASADLGSRVHAHAETLNNGGQVDLTPEERPFVDRYNEFVADMRPEFLAVEFMGISRKHGYAGTGDFIANIGGHLTCVDIKTGSGIYPETAMQLAACAGFDFIGKEADPTEYPVPKVERYAVLHLRPEGYRLVPYRVDESTFAAFLSALALFRWKNGQAKTVMAPAIAREEPAA